MKLCAPFVFLALTLTIASAFLWVRTGREVLTKRVRITEIERAPDTDDFLDIARADDDGMVRETRRDEGFWFGLLPSGYPRPGAWSPAPEWASVLSIVAPAWCIAGGACLVSRRRFHNEKSPEE